MKIAVTGSSGFIGSYLVKRLKNLNIDIMHLDILQGFDITDWNQAKKLDGFDILFHLAAKTYVPDSYKFPRDFYNTNIISVLNCLELCRLHNSKMIFTSSYVYGIPQYLPIDEEHPVSAFNPYAQSKLIGEQLCKAYNRDFGIPAIIFRPFNIYGIGQNADFLIPAIIKQANSHKIILKDPEPKRDFIYINDVIDALIKAIDYDKSTFEIFNIGSGISYSVKEMAEIILSFYDKSTEIEYSGERRDNEVLNTVADISKTKKLLDWTPNTTIYEGLQRMVHNNQ